MARGVALPEVEQPALHDRARARRAPERLVQQHQSGSTETSRISATRRRMPPESSCGHRRRSAEGRTRAACAALRRAPPCAAHPPPPSPGRRCHHVATAEAGRAADEGDAAEQIEGVATAALEPQDAARLRLVEMPATMLNSALLPQPPGPTTVTNSAGVTAASRPCSAVTDPKELLMPGSPAAARPWARRPRRGRRGRCGFGECRQGTRESCIMKAAPRMCLAHAMRRLGTTCRGPGRHEPCCERRRDGARRRANPQGKRRISARPGRARVDGQHGRMYTRMRRLGERLQ